MVDSLAVIEALTPIVKDDDAVCEEVAVPERVLLCDAVSLAVCDALAPRVREAVGVSDGVIV